MAREVYIIKSDCEVGIEHSAFHSEEDARKAFEECWLEVEDTLDNLPYYEVREYWLED